MRLNLLVVVGISLLLGALPAAIITRRQRTRSEGSFPCRVSVQSGQVPGLVDGYRRQRCFWVHDVLVIHRGRVFPRAQPLGIRSADGIEAPKLHLVAVRLHLDEGAVIKVIAHRSASSLLVGPFLAAEVEDVIRADS